MIHPEKNDVDISKLFAWGKQFSIRGLYSKEEYEVYLRLAGDADISRSRTYGIRRSADLRKKLKTEDTDERVAFIASVYDVDDQDQLIDLIISLRVRDFAQDAVKEVKIELPKEPRTDAKLEDLEKFQQLVDNFETTRNAKLNEFVFRRIEAVTEELKTKTIEQLRAEYERATILMLCEQEMYKTFREHCIYLSAYLDPEYKTKLFSSFDEFENLPSDVKDQFLNCYSLLEIDMDSLKKSLEAMR